MIYSIPFLYFFQERITFIYLTNLSFFAILSGHIVDTCGGKCVGDVNFQEQSMNKIFTCVLLVLLGCGESRSSNQDESPPASDGDTASQGEGEGEPGADPQDGPERICDPGRQVSCDCLDGTQGVQVCADSGLRFDQCMCGPVREEADECIPLDTRPCSCADRQEGVERCHPRGYWTRYCECPVEPEEGLICDPGRTVECPCGNSQTGVQDCQLDGRSYTPCRCPIPEDPPDNGGGDDIPRDCEMPLKECDVNRPDLTCPYDNHGCGPGTMPEWHCLRYDDGGVTKGCRPAFCECVDDPDAEPCARMPGVEQCDEDEDAPRECEDPLECPSGFIPREVCIYEDPVECTYYHPCACIEEESG